MKWNLDNSIFHKQQAAHDRYVPIQFSINNRIVVTLAVALAAVAAGINSNND